MAFPREADHGMGASASILHTLLLGMNTGCVLFINPAAVHAFSASCHLLLLLSLFFFWFCRRSSSSSSKKRGVLPASLLFYKASLFNCLILCLFHASLFIYDLFWYIDDGGVSYEQHLSIQVDLGIRAISWLGISAYLHFSFCPFSEKSFPALLRIWWGLYLLISVSSILLDLFCYRKLSIVDTHLWVLDFGSFLSALFLNYAGVFGKRVEKGSDLLQDSLLNGVHSPNDRLLSANDVRLGKVSLFSNANFLSILTFSWMGPLLSVGHNKTLDLSDVPQLDHGDSVDGVLPIFKSKLESCTGSSLDRNIIGNINKTAQISSFQLAKVLVFSAWGHVLATAVYALMYTVSSYVGPYLIDFFVQYLNGNQTFANEGYVLVVAFIVAKLIECLSQRHWFFRLQQAGIRVRAFLVSIIYQKGLTLSSRSRQGHTTGEIINIMSVDADRISLFSWYMHDLWMVPIQVALALFILYASLGLASLAALAATFIVMLANVPLGKMQEKYQEKMMEAKDTRMKATSEILRNMRILKLQGWEMKFLSKIDGLRKSETNWLRKYVYTSAMTTFVFWGAPTFVAVITFGACVLMDIPLESGKVLSALATFRVLQEPIYNLPDTISMVVQTKVSLGRISSFLCLEDLQAGVVEMLPRGSSNVAIEVRDGTFSWDHSSEAPTIRDLKFEVLHGMKVAVCGTVGSGKSSLLACILGEGPKIAETMKLCGSVAYVCSHHRYRIERLKTIYYLVRRWT